MTEAARTFSKDESLVEMREVGGALYVVTTLAIYRVDGDRLRPLEIAPPEDPSAAASLENVSAERLADMIDETVNEQLMTHVADIDWLAAAGRVIEMIKSGAPGAWPSGCRDADSCLRHGECMYVNCRWRDKDISAHLPAKTQAEPGPVTFDPHVGSPLASDGGFIDDVAKMRKRNGLT